MPLSVHVSEEGAHAVRAAAGTRVSVPPGSPAISAFCYELV